MAATYLLRFDDICPTMNWAVWHQVEEALIDAGVSPILAVVPDNQDRELVVDIPQPKFWEAARRWQSRGWTIGLHGYEHRYVTQDAGIIGRNRYSEFAGLPYDAQLAKVRSGLAIFEREGVKADIWVAPAHSFDCNTLDALAHCGLRTVSDGYSALPHTDSRGTFWIPQQLGRFRGLPAGVWTVCHHHNSWGPGELRRFRNELDTYGDRISNFNEIVCRYAGRRKKWLDSASAGLMSLARTSRLGVSA